MGLAEQVRRKLRITYSDPDTDERVDDIMEQADADLRGLLGIDDDGFSFAQPGTEQVLFLAYCFYEWNDALDDFGANYATKIAQCRDRWLVKQYVEEEQAASQL